MMFIDIVNSLTSFTLVMLFNEYDMSNTLPTLTPFLQSEQCFSITLSEALSILSTVHDVCPASKSAFPSLIRSFNFYVYSIDQQWRINNIVKKFVYIRRCSYYMWKKV